MLRLENISFAYNKTPVLKDINFTLKQGEHVSIIGESGSGKSTLLKLIYGEFDLNKGHVFWKDVEIFGPKFNLVIGYDFMKYVSQEFDLMPFTSVEDNVGKYLSNFFPEEKQERIAELIDVVELSEFSKTKVKLLSGGQKQRVALARAIAKQPEIILLDEPFSHIDNFKKQSLRRRLFNYLKAKKITCVLATHDKEDVLGYTDRIIVLDQAKVMANEKPEELYKNPKTNLVASFFEEFNTIKPYGIIYANQLNITDKSDIKVTVNQSYFKGDYYLVEAIYNEEIIFFNSNKKRVNGEKIYLEIIKKNS